VSAWAVGYLVGTAVVVIVVVVLVAMIALAKRIADTAEDILAALGDAERNTAGLWEVRTTNRTVERVTAAAADARETLEGGGR
jgi:hypothetical protein